MSKKTMRPNRNIQFFDEAMIKGWPCFWWSFRAGGKYNRFVAFVCNHAKDGMQNWPLWARLLYMPVFCWMIFMDEIWAKKEHKR